jgi:hypothetical protein
MTLAPVGHGAWGEIFGVAVSLAIVWTVQKRLIAGNGAPDTGQMLLISSKFEAIGSPRKRRSFR